MTELINLLLTRLDPDGKLYLNKQHVGWIDREVGVFLYGCDAIRYRARTVEGSSLGVYPTRAAAERAVLTQK